MLMKAATWFGIIMLVVGILGFIGPLTPNGLLFGLFAVDGLHNTVHLLTGAVAVWVGLTSERASRLYFQIFGIIYGVLFLIGLAAGNSPLLGVMAHNWADVWLHLAITAFALYMGFFYRVSYRKAHPADRPH
ncbi:MAG: DUF4383 domain-containing protein [Gammaproteobacteria bacterium]|nr:DUF4383 domain-containing protein [Gammaproteobacteria bacterium]